ncbi:hypothetical protein MBLNU13_g01101t1 [Cladosporium sp. NU13]
MASDKTEKVAIKGGCHCGFITYTAHTTLNAAGTLSATRCNCSFCQRLGATNLSLASVADFTLHTPASRSELGDYAPRVKSVHRYFCRTCGAHVWMEGEYPLGGGKMMPVCAMNLGTVDVETLPEGVDLRRTEMKYYDMLHNNVAGGAKEGPWEGGLI